MYIGWLHHSAEESQYKQVRMKEGGGIWEFIYNNDDEITVDVLTSKATKFFFPEGKSKVGTIDHMRLELGNYLYAQETMTSFTDTSGKTCTFQKYLKSRRLLASRFYVYLMSTGEELETPEHDSLVEN